MFAALPLLLLCFTAVASQKLERSPRRVIGGNDLDKTVWQNKLKWVVALDARVKGDSDTYSCGGSLIAKKWVLTAAHCFSPARKTNVGTAYVGVYNLCYGGECGKSEGQHIEVVRAIPHPAYNDGTMVNDIALLELASEVVGIEPVPIATQGFSVTDNFGGEAAVEVYGWGDVNKGANAFDHPSVLQVGGLDLVSQSACNSEYGYSKTEILASMVCARRQGIDACQGDSGGPLYHMKRGELVGVVSWGFGCAKKKFPGVYADVGYFNKWINEHASGVKNGADGTPSPPATAGPPTPPPPATPPPKFEPTTTKPPPSAGDCRSNQFFCKVAGIYGSCISNGWVCDRQADCGDGADELDDLCANNDDDESTTTTTTTAAGDNNNNNGNNNGNNGNCGAQEGQCATGTSAYGNDKCYNLGWKCDGMADCNDGSDEVNAHCKNQVCQASEFNCVNYRSRPCLPDRFVCDGNDDCDDGSDESDATCKSGAGSPTCAQDEFLCTSDDTCISGANRCDSIRDCSGGEDERDCTCADGEFLCAAGAADKTNARQVARQSPCIPAAQKCDAVDDCFDAADESLLTCSDTSEGNGCKCKAQWSDPEFSDKCGVTQNGCEAKPCDQDTHGPWCHVSNPGCDGSIGADGAWAYCQPAAPTAALPDCTCKQTWHWAETAGDDAGKLTRHGCAVIEATGDGAWCYTTEECKGSQQSGKYPEKNWAYCTIPETTSASSKTTVAADGSGSCGSACKQRQRGTRYLGAKAAATGAPATTTPADPSVTTENGCTCDTDWGIMASIAGCENAGRYDHCNMKVPCDGDDGPNGGEGLSWCKIADPDAKGCNPQGDNWDYCRPPN